MGPPNRKRTAPPDSPSPSGPPNRKRTAPPDSAGAERIYPAEFGGYGKKAGLPAEDLGGLKDVSFVSQCPPDLSPSARILAICGITDHKNDADLENDGWFFSDFYLFHHLFKGIGAHQIWLTSEHPEDLIDKYGSNIHGNPFEERREVLNNDLLDEISKSNNLRVVSRCKSAKAIVWMRTIIRR